MDIMFFVFVFMVVVVIGSWLVNNSQEPKPEVSRIHLEKCEELILHLDSLRESILNAHFSAFAEAEKQLREDDPEFDPDSIAFPAFSEACEVKTKLFHKIITIFQVYFPQSDLQVKVSQLMLDEADLLTEIVDKTRKITERNGSLDELKEVINSVDDGSLFEQLGVLKVEALQLAPNSP